MGTENLDRAAVGAVYVNPGSGEVSLGAIRELSIKVDGKDIPHYDVSGYPFGVDMHVFGTVDIQVEVVWEEIANIALWAYCLHGTAGLAATNAGTTAVTDEALILSGDEDSAWHAVTYAHDFDAGETVTVKDGPGGTPHTENTDYYVNRENGTIARVAGGGISDGEAVYVSYTYATYDGYTFEILSDTVPDEYAIRILKPLLNGNNLRIRHTKVVFSTSQELSLSPGDEGEWVGATSTIKFLKHDSTYGNYGTWEIYTP
jgi:hypothetical protein